jgi:hypothetical protein
MFPPKKNCIRLDGLKRTVWRGGRDSLRLLAILLAAAALPLVAQSRDQADNDFRFPERIERLSSRAKETVVVTLDGRLLQLAASFITDEDKHDAQIRKIIQGLKGIYVRTFEFGNEGEYDAADLEAARSRFPSPEWSRIVNVRSEKYDNCDIYFKVTSDGKLGGVGVVASDPTTLTVVNVIGIIDPADVGHLCGEFGIPRMELHGGWWRDDQKAQPKDDEGDDK